MKESSRKIKDLDVTSLFDAASTYDVVEMREAVTKLISESRVPNQAILRKIPTMSKQQLMKTLSNYYLAGLGMRVYKW